MRRICAVTLACGMAACGGHEMAPPTTVPIEPITFDAVFVVNGGDASISVINAQTDELAGTIRLQNADYPHHIYLSADRATVLVAVPGADLSAGHTGGGHAGHGDGGAVLALEANTGALKVARRLDAPNHNALFAPGGNAIWTTQTTRPGQVLILDPATLETRMSAQVGDDPSEVTFSPSGAYAFVANTGSDSVSVLDPATGSVVQTIPVGDAPVGAWPGADGVMYVDNEAGKSITAIDASSLTVVRTYDLGFTPAVATVAPTGELWVTDTDAGRIVFFAAGDGTAVGELATGAGAHAIAFSADGAKAYVTNQIAGTASVIDVASTSVTKTITVGSKPNGLVYRAR